MIPFVPFAPINGSKWEHHFPYHLRPYVVGRQMVNGVVPFGRLLLNQKPGWLVSFTPGLERLNVCRIKSVPELNTWPTKNGGMAACGWSLSDTLQSLNDARGLHD